MALGYRSLIFDISANVAKLTQDLDKAMGAFRKMEKNVSTIATSIRTAWIIGIGYAMKRAIDDITKTGEGFIKLSKQTGLSVEEVQKLQFAAEQSETSFEDLTLGIGRMNKAIYELRKPSSEAAKELSKMGFTIKDIGSTPLENLLKFADVFSKIDNASKRGALAMEVFGKSGKSLLPVLSQGRAGIEAYLKEAEKLGIMSEEMAKKSDEYRDAVNRLQQSFKYFAITLLEDVIPALTDFMDKLNTLLKGEPMGRSTAIDWIEQYELRIKALKQELDPKGPWQGLQALLSPTSTEEAIKEIETLERKIQDLKQKWLTHAIRGKPIGILKEPIEDELPEIDKKIQGLFDKWQEKKLELLFSINMQGFDETAMSIEKIKLQYAKMLMEFKQAEKEGLRMPGMEKLIGQAKNAEVYNEISKAYEKMVEEITSIDPYLDKEAVQFEKLSRSLGELTQTIYKAGEEYTPFVAKLLAMQEKLDSLSIDSRIAKEKELTDRINEITLNRYDFEKQKILDAYQIRALTYGYTEQLAKALDLELKKLAEDEMKRLMDISDAMAQQRITELEMKLKIGVVMPEQELAIVDEELMILTKRLEDWQQRLNEVSEQPFSSDEKIEQMLFVEGKIADITKQIIDLTNREKELSGSFGEGFSDGIEKAINDLGTLNEQGKQLAHDVAGNIESAFKDLFGDIITGEMESFSDYWTKFWQSMAKSMSDIIAEELTKALLKGLGSDLLRKLFGGLGGLFGGGPSSWNEILGSGPDPYHKGGIVTLHKGTGGLASDEIFAKLKKMERVLSPEQTGVFDSIMAKIPAFTQPDMKRITNNVDKSYVSNPVQNNNQFFSFPLPPMEDRTKRKEAMREIEEFVVATLRKYS